MPNLPSTCRANGCDRPVARGGYCAGHRARVRNGTPVDGPLRVNQNHTGCLVTGCAKPHAAKGYCHNHYEVRRRKAHDNAKRCRPVASLPGERWRPIPDFEGAYEVSDLGRVRSVTRTVYRPAGRRAASSFKRCGKLISSDNIAHYAMVNLSHNGRRHPRRVHALVTSAFLGPCPDGAEVNHIDYDKRNNQLGNLEYVTHQENMRHAFARDTAAC